MEMEDKIMTEMVDINVIIDENFTEPKIDIYTKSKTEQVNDIINAIENISRNSYPPVLVNSEGKLNYISQRDIYRIRTEGREIILDTEDESYVVKGPMSRFDEELDSERFFRISQSEIVNLYKVKSFDFNLKGTVSVELDNGQISWVARRIVKPLRDKLKNSFGSDK